MVLLWEAWVRVYEETYYNLILGQQEGTTAWINLWAPRKFYPVGNDLSLLIPTDMYREFFLEELVNEINYLEYSMYHLDGEGALHHLDMILDIPKLNAVQWIRCGRKHNRGSQVDSSLSENPVEEKSNHCLLRSRGS